MKIFFPNLNILNIKCDSTDNRKEQRSCVVVPSKGWVKRSDNYMKDIIGISIAYWRLHLRWGALNKTRKLTFSVTINF